MANSEDDETEVPKPGKNIAEEAPCESLSSSVKVAKTASMALFFFVMGLYNGLTGPTMIDMKDLLGINYEELSTGLMLRPLGAIFGAFIGGYMVDKWTKWTDGILGVWQVIVALAVAAIPWSPNMVVYMVLQFIFGLSNSAAAVMCNTMVLVIWGGKAGPPVHLVQTTVLLGALIAPPASGPFMSHPIESTLSENFNNTLVTSTMIGQFNSTTAQMTQSLIYIPFGAFAFFGLLVAILFLILMCVTPTYASSRSSEKPSLKKMLSPSSCSPKYPGFSIYMLVSILFIYISLFGRDYLAMGFMMPIAVEYGHMSKMSATWAFFTMGLTASLGRVIGAILVKWIPIAILLFVELILTIICLILILIFALDGPTELWVTFSIAVLFAGPTYPAIMAWVDRYIVVTGVTMAFIKVSMGAGTFIATYVYGLMYERYGAVELFYYAFANAIFLLIILIPLQITACFIGDRHNMKDIDAEENEDGVTESAANEKTPL